MSALTLGSPSATAGIQNAFIVGGAVDPVLSQTENKFLFFFIKSGE